MNKTTWTILAAAVSCAGIFAVTGRVHVAAAPAPQSASARVPVIVELFTSEGCSSCPPADTLLSRLQTEQPVRSAEVIAIEEHVDYWDQLGWRDPFSSPDWTDRQRSYAEVLRDHGVYTPEMVVDGSEGFVGSRAQESGERIQEAAARGKTPVTLSVEGTDQKNHAEVAVHVGELPEAQNPRESAEVWLVVTESGLHSAVTAGENDGRSLYHAPVLRKIQKIGTVERGKPQGFAGQTSVSWDGQWNVRNLTVVAFVQERRSKRILGAASAPLRVAP